MLLFYFYFKYDHLCEERVDKHDECDECDGVWALVSSRSARENMPVEEKRVFSVAHFISASM